MKKGFTLAEVMVVLVVLGIIASITVPQVVKRQIEATNRAKIKKAMSVYDTIISRIVIENNIKNKENFISWADTNEKNNCQNTSAYFKKTDGNGCVFRTTDGVWWDIDDILNPIISLKKDNLKKENAIDKDNKDTFVFTTAFDPVTGAFRTNDYLYERNINRQDEALEKLFSFTKIEKIKRNSDYVYIPEVPYDWDEEFNNSKKSCNSSHISETAQKDLYNKNGYANCTDYSGGFFFYTFDRDGKVISYASGCGNSSTISGCLTQEYKKYDKNGNIYEYESFGNYAHCETKPCLSLGYNDYDEEGRIIASFYRCSSEDRTTCDGVEWTDYTKSGATINYSSCKNQLDKSTCSGISETTNNYTYYENIDINTKEVKNSSCEAYNDAGIQMCERKGFSCKVNTENYDYCCNEDWETGECLETCHESYSWNECE